MDIIFDLDGTMWNSTKEICIAWNNVLKQNNSVLNFDNNFFNKIMGKSNEDIKLILKNEYFINKEDFLDYCQKEELVVLKNQGAFIYPNVIETIKTLSKKHNLYIASNCQNGYIDCFLDYYNVRECFKDYICSDNIYKNKTESLSELIKKNNIKDFYYIGDTQGDFTACSNLGGKFIFVSYGFGFVDTENKIDNFSELLDVFI